MQGSVHPGDDHGVNGFDFHAAEVDFALRIVGLQGDRAFPELAVGPLEEAGFRVLGDRLAVDLDLDGPADDGDVAGEPLVIFCRGLVLVPDSVEAARLFIVRVGIVDLGFVTAVGPTALLVLRVEVDPGVGAWLGKDFGPEFEVLEVCRMYGACVEKVAPRPVDQDATVFNFAGVFVF